MASYVKLKAQVTKKTDKSDFKKTKNFCASKDTIKKVKREHIGWKKNFANHVSDNRVVSRTY